jgi:Mannosyltransferase (PIG-V)
VSEDVRTPQRAPAVAVAQPPRRPGGSLTASAARIFLASRLIAVAGILAAHWVSGLSIRLILIKWDAHWYLAVAQHGYPNTATPLPGQAELRLAFFPLFPLLLAPLSALGPNTILAATAVGTAFGLAATVAVAHLAKTVSLRSGADAAAADRTALAAVALFAFFPGAVVLSLAYTEGLAIAAAVGCLLALLHRRWLTAGLCAAVATATRPNALGLVVACAWACGEAVRQRREWRSLLAPLLAPLGCLGYLSYLQIHVGDWRAWQVVEARGWHQNVDFSARLLRLLSPQEVIRHAAHTDWDYFSIVAGLVFVLVAVVCLVRWRPPNVLGAYTAGTLAFCFLSSRVGPRPRMILIAIPLFLACAERLPARQYRLLLGSCAVLTLAMSYFVSMGRIIP